MSEADRAPFEKEVVQLPDGRRLVYYRFPVAPPRAEPGAAASAAPGAASGKER